MSEDIENSENGFLQVMGKTFGCLIFIAVFLFILLWIIAGFTANPKADGTVVVNDEANILSDFTEIEIENIRFPEDIPVVIRTVSSIPKGKMATFATDLMSEEPQWQTLRPRGWLRRYMKLDSPSGTGVYILISRDPLLLQIRFGREIQLKTYQQGLAIGNWYRDRQLFKIEDIDKHLLETVEELAQKMQKVKYLPWPLSWVQRMSSTVYSELEFWLIPPGTLFFKVVLKNYIVLANKLGATGSTWSFIIFGISVIIFMWLIVKKLLVNQLILPLIKRPGLQWLIKTLSNIGILGAFTVSFASLAALSKGRIEDELALKEQGLSFVANVGFDSTLFSTSGGLWIAIPGAIIMFFSEIAEADEIQKKTGETGIPKEWLAWGCLLYLLPKAMAISALVLLIFGVFAKIAQSTSEDST